MKNSYNLGVVLIFFIFRWRNSSLFSSIKFIVFNFSLKKGKWKKIEIIEIKKENIHTVELLLYIYIYIYIYKEAWVSPRFWGHELPSKVNRKSEGRCQNMVKIRWLKWLSKNYMSDVSPRYWKLEKLANLLAFVFKRIKSFGVPFINGSKNRWGGLYLFVIYIYIYIYIHIHICLQFHHILLYYMQ